MAPSITLAEEILAQYDLYRDEGQLSWVLGECANGLLACLKAQSDLPQGERLKEGERETLLTSLLTLWHFGDRSGGITPDLAPMVVALATASERTRLEAWVRENMHAGQDASISGAIDYGRLLLAQVPYKPVRRVIDVSGDGSNNSGRPVTSARDEAAARGDRGSRSR